MEINLNKKYRVKNLTDSIIITVAPGLSNRRREWVSPGAVNYVPLEEIENVVQTYGGRSIYEKSLKVYAEDDILEFLGLETNKELETSDKALKELFDLDYVSFEKRLKNYPKDVYSRIVRYAAENNIKDLDIIDILAENTKINVLSEIRKYKEKHKTKKKTTYEKINESKNE